MAVVQRVCTNSECGYIDDFIVSNIREDELVLDCPSCGHDIKLKMNVNSEPIKRIEKSDLQADDDDKDNKNDIEGNLEKIDDEASGDDDSEKSKLPSENEPVEDDEEDSSDDDDEENEEDSDEEDDEDDEEEKKKIRKPSESMSADNLILEVALGKINPSRAVDLLLRRNS